jgi:hypothetical protein
MDTGHYPSLGRLAQLSAQLSAARRRLAALDDAPVDEGERLLRAATASDWLAIAALSEHFATRSSDSADERLVRSAQKTRAALRRDPSGGRARRQLKELMTACREMKLRRRAG